MPAHYTVVHYVPDPIADERINVGVIAFGDGCVRVRFLRRWDRVRQFGGEDISFLKEFASRVTKAASDQSLLGLEGDLHLQEEAVRWMADDWINSVQLSRPRASLRGVDDLLEEISRLFLREDIRNPKTFRDRQQAAKIAGDQVTEGVARRLGIEAAKRLVDRRYRVAGKYRERKLDVAVHNGTVYFGAHALSFELQDMKELGEQIDLTARALSDLRTANPDLPLAVAALPPRAGMPESKRLRDVFQQARREFGDMHVALMTEDEIDHWAADQASKLPADLVAHLVQLPLTSPRPARWGG